MRFVRFQRRIVSLVAAGLAAGLSVSIYAQDPQADFERARLLEESPATLSQAIALYKQVADRATANRRLTAQALLRAAEGHQKLGQAEARALYERVVKEFGDLPAAQTARTRLGVSGTASTTGRSIQQIATIRDPRTDISPDGRYLIASDEGQLALREVATGRIRRLTEPAPGPAEPYWSEATFSPDGRQIAYLWFSDANANDDDGVLRVVNTGEGRHEPRTLYSNPDVTSITPQDWSPDGAWIAVQVRRADRSAQIGVVDVATGALRVLRTVDWIGSSFLSFSPDSRYLAYDRPFADGEVERDVFVMAIDGSRESSSANPGDDRVVGWSRDGARLLLSSDRGGTIGLWAAPFHDGTLRGAPEYLSDFGNARPLGLTDDGALYAAVLQSAAGISVVPFDVASGKVSGPITRPVRRFSGLNTSPAWSPDGRYLAYLSKRDPLVPSPMTVVIHAADTGEVVRELRPKAAYLGTLRWGGPGGQWFIARGADIKGRAGILRIDARTGDTALAAPESVCTGVPFWSADGATFFCHDFSQRRGVEMDALSGEVRRQFKQPTGQPWGASPDGRFVMAYLDGALVSIALATEEHKEIIRFSAESRVTNGFSLSWSPDSRAIVYSGTFRGRSGMWYVPIDGGEPHQIALEGADHDTSQWQFNPITGQVAFGPSPRPTYEVRKIENFLAGTRK
jgi:Tol biopolymer transport system component